MTVHKSISTRILIVDDEPIIALSLEEVLVDAGFNVAAVAYKIEKALAVIEGSGCDAAIIDVNLAGVNSSQIATALTLRGLPFIVLSGYSSEQLLSEFPGAIFMQKPCRPTRLIEAVRLMVRDK